MVGIHIGTLVHLVAATVGLSAILASSATAFTRRQDPRRGLPRLPRRPDAARPGGRRRGARRRRRGHTAATSPHGIVVNILNPKTALFFLAFLPQFVDPSRGRPSLQILVLGLTFMVLGLVTDSIWALAAGTAGERLRGAAAGRSFSVTSRARSSSASALVTALTGFAPVVQLSSAASGALELKRRPRRHRDRRRVACALRLVERSVGAVEGGERVGGSRRAAFRRPTRWPARPSSRSRSAARGSPCGSARRTARAAGGRGRPGRGR